MTFFSSTSKAQALSQEFGILGAIPSLGTDAAKQSGIDKIVDLSIGWTRHEFHYLDSMNFEHYDAAQAKAKAKDIKTLALLVYPGADKSHDQWKTYVRSIAEHYGNEMPAYEIMNEADNYLSGADYVVYLREAHEIIKAVNPGAIVVLSGITSRPETPNFWNAVGAAGGWPYFDVAGLHVYHEGNPEKVNFGGGDLLAEYDRAIAALKKNGGGKKIWITETGYKTSDVGEDNQAKWLTRTLAMTRAVSIIEKIFIYRLWDGDGSTYGLTTSGMAPRPAYEAVKDIISNLSGAGFGTRLYPQTKQTLDSLDTVTGWSTKANSNATAILSASEGKYSGAMRINYTFTADKAYVVAEKIISINGQPQALAAWFYGDDTKNVWKYRFKDTKGETFQADLGNLVSGWNYKQFTIGQDVAYVSWDGDGTIDYPISFNSFVVDRQGGEATAEGIVDELVAITGGADLYAFQFGNKIGYWKVSGNSTAQLCGEAREFTQSVRFAVGVNCTDTPKTAVATVTPAAAAATTAAAATATPSAKPTEIPSPAVTQSPILTLDKNKSTIRVDGSNVLANGQDNYRVVILLKDSGGNTIKDRPPVSALLAENTAVVVSQPVLVGDEWWITVKSTQAGEVQLTVKVGDVIFDPVVLVFTAVMTPNSSPSPTTPTPIATVKSDTPSKVLIAGLVSGGSVALLGVIFALWWFKIGKPRFGNIRTLFGRR